MSDPLRLIGFPRVREKLGFVDNRSVRSACARFGIAIVELSPKNLNLRESDLALLLDRASVKNLEI
jgi:hypothetical protein